MKKLIAALLLLASLPLRADAPAQIVVSCGTLKGVGMLILIEDGQRYGMPIICGTDV